MGNPTAQSRTTASKPNMKPKHRLSGSVSNISFTSEDLKPKHRHSGSASNICLTPEDLKPKHGPNGSVSNISNITSTPEDLWPKHHRSGSFSNISISSKDCSSSSRGDCSSPPSVLSVTSASVSLKEKRLKRRTRSSLGGTEDFIKELDFLTTSSNGRNADNYTRKELLKLSPSAPVSEPASLQEASETLPAVPESIVPAHIEGVAENIFVEDSNHSVLAKADVNENGGSLHYETLTRSGNESVRQSDAVQLAEPKCNGVDRESTGSVGTSNADHRLVINGVGEPGSQLENSSAVSNGHLPVAAAAHPMVGATTEVSDSTEVPDILKETEENPESVVAVRPPANSLASDKAGSRILHHSSGTQEFTNSRSTETAVSGGIVRSSETADCQVDRSTEELSRGNQEAGDLQEEKVSVQKRVEELEKIARGRPVHFRSQSLSLPRPFDISHAKHHEAEGSKGFKMPAYRAPLNCISISEVSSLEQVGMSPDVELREESLHCKGKALTDRTASTTPAVHEVSVPETDPRNASQSQEGHSDSQAAKSPSDDISGKPKPEPHFVPVLSEGLKAVEASSDRVANGIRVENGTTAESFQSMPAEKTESAVQSGTPDDLKTQPTIEKEKMEVIGKEDGVEAGLGEPSVIVRANSVPQEFPVIPTVTHTEAPADHTKGESISGLGIGQMLETLFAVRVPLRKTENGGTVETAEAGVLVEPLAGRQKTGKIRMIPAASQTGVLPVTHQRNALPEAPSVQASITEHASQDYETSMLLTKQPAVDPLFIDSQLDRLWEMHSQELTIGESSGNELRESSEQDDDPRHFANGIHSHAEVTPATSNGPNENAQSDKSGKHDRPRTPLRSLLAEEDAEKSPDSRPIGTPPQNQSASPRGSLFKRIVSGGKNSPTKQTTPTKFSPKNQTAAKPFLSSCICCSVK